MLTPNHVVIAARAVLALGAATATILMLGPFQGLEAVLGLTDKSAHALAFGALTAVSFAAFPRLRRSDLAQAALILGGAAEIAQMFGGRTASLADWAADAVGIGTVYGASLIESARKMARDHGHLPLSTIIALDRRKAGGPKHQPIAPGAEAMPDRFAERASRHFPRRPAA
ncbi:VanZ family protein [Caulobacter henricii]|uniref:Antibiotic resistance protein VanZ n=1 Tax=Caulobacter henricii TaxID=69395 RepID=A0A0P0P041_9CAUL|nr:VanZ family protein [Caulobacter henricii]ALL13763.1 antibiotic resistance protein VanZ [Caulobacter henricii]